MNTFTASNGISVEVNDDQVIFDMPNRPTSPIWLRADEIDALREFFRAEEDKRLGRWRWPDNSEFVVYPETGGMREVQVVSEPTGCWGQWSEADARREANLDSLARAAVAYFDAHPEPKPWHDAKPREAWVVTVGEETNALLVVDFHSEGRCFADADELITVPVDSPEITDARRIWPEP